MGAPECLPRCPLCWAQGLGVAADLLHECCRCWDVGLLRLDRVLLPGQPGLRSSVSVGQERVLIAQSKGVVESAARIMLQAWSCDGHLLTAQHEFLLMCVTALGCWRKGRQGLQSLHLALRAPQLGLAHQLAGE